MHRWLGAFVAAAIAALAPPAQAGTGIGFRLHGGYSYVRYADFNDSADHLNERELPGLGVSEKLDNIHWIPELRGELFFSPGGGVTVGAGAGIISGSSGFSYGTADEGLSYEHSVDAYPIGATCYYAIPVPTASIRPYVYGGVAAVYSTIAFDVTLTAGGTSDGLDAELSTWGFELRGGAGVGLPIFASVSIDLGVTGRWAELSGYEGSATFIGGGTDDVFLAKERTELTYLFGPESVEDRSRYEEASVDLTGVAVTIGVTVTF